MRDFKIFWPVLVLVAGFLMASKAQECRSQFGRAIFYLIERMEYHPKKTDPAWADGIAVALEKAAGKYGEDRFDKYLLAAMGERESKFRPDILKGKLKGKAGEIGILQCGPDCARKCPYFMDDIEGQALCGARWLQMSWDSCKGRGKKYTDEFRALVKYASGIHCEPPEDSDFGWKARRRISMANKLRNKFASE